MYNKCILFAACTNVIFLQDKEEDAAQKAIDRYVIFVDSVNQAKHDKRAQRWHFIEEEHARKRNDAEAALLLLKGNDKETEQKRINESDTKYKGIKAVIEQ